MSQHIKKLQEKNSHQSIYPYPPPLVATSDSSCCSSSTTSSASTDTTTTTTGCLQVSAACFKTLPYIGGFHQVFTVVKAEEKALGVSFGPLYKGTKNLMKNHAKKSQPALLSPGDSFYVSPGQTATIRNISTGKASLLTWVCIQANKSNN